MDMFRFANPEYLYGLALIPVFIILYILSRRARRKAIIKFGSPELMADLMPNVSTALPRFKFSILMVVMALLIVAVARPQFGSKLQTDKRKGVEIMIALDVSNSMMAEDIQPNRLERAKRAIVRLTERLNNDKIGLIVFAGDAYTQIPITQDYSSAKLFLNSINTSIVPRQGTAIGSAIDLGMKSFTPESEISKAMIIITDGENHEDNATEMATLAAESGIVVHTIGMGLPKGSPIPIQTRNGQPDFQRDNDGNIVVTKLNETMLQEISAAGEGIYVRANNAEVGLNRIFDEINAMDKQELETRVYSDYNDQFHYFVLIAFILLFIEFFISERKSKLSRKMKLFSVEK